MHSRYGLKTEYLGREWFDCISACVEQARETGMKACLYDDDRWPSGPAGGIVTRSNKKYRMRYLVAGNPNEMNARLDSPSDRLGLFSIKLDEKGRLKSYQRLEKNAEADPGVMAFDVRIQPPRPWENDAAYLDTMNTEAVAEFLKVTHEAYRKRFGGLFGGVIPAIFTDEPNYGLAAMIWFCEDIDEKYRTHWTCDLPEQFRQRRGYDLVPFLPELVFARDRGRFSRVAYDYYRTLTELFNERFMGQIGSWCEKNKIALTGHVLFEETMRSQICAVGAAMPHYEHMHWPGVDVLSDKKPEILTVKQCASAADQLGKQRVLSELYGCTGWDWPLEGHKYTADWQLALGVNFLCPHLTHYSLAGGAKRDFPASIFSHSPWWKHYGAVNDYLGRLCGMLAQGRPIRDILVIHPIESEWGLFSYAVDRRAFEHDDPHAESPLDRALADLSFAFTGAHLDWDFGDERLLAKYGSIEGSELAVGRMRYRLAVVPPLLTLRSSTVSLLQDFLDAGGEVLFAGSEPDRVDGRLDGRAADLVKRSKRCGRDDLASTVERLLRRRVSISEKNVEQACVWAMLRRLNGGMLVFFQSHDRQKPHLLTVRLAEGGRPVVLWNALTAARTYIDAAFESGGAVFDLELEPSGSALVTLGIDVPDVEKPAALELIRSQTVKEPYEIELTEPNTLPLDYCRFRLNGGSFSEPMPTLKVDGILRRRFGISTRLGYEQQPWHLKKSRRGPRGPLCRLELCYRFHVTDPPGECRLVLEKPEDFNVTVNGRATEKCDGFWVDEDFSTTDITAFLEAGENIVLLSCDLRDETALEDIYLAGDFGTAKRDQGMPLAPDNVTLTSPAGRLRTGPWAGQGLDFYGGAVVYKIRVKKPPRMRRLRLRLPSVKCTAAAVYAGGKTYSLPWAPFEADITESLEDGFNDVAVEVVGGRKNILGPLHVPWLERTGPEQFNPDHPQWTFEYLLNDHGLMEPPELQILV